jgi:hypothetical protein
VKVFLSYPSERAEEAKEVRDFVRSVNVDCWFDKDNLIAGQDWDRARKLALADADLVLLICATETVSRDGVYQREINEALRSLDDKRLGTIYLLPIRLENVALPPEIGRLHYLDKFRPNWRGKLAIALKKAIEERGDGSPRKLDVAAAISDEGGIVPREISEERPEGTLQVDWPHYTFEGDYWDFVNAEIASRALGGLFATRRRLTEWWQKSGSDWELHISEFHRKGQLVSLTIGHSEYFAGAAHPNHGIETLNIFGEEAGVISVAELFDHSPAAISFLTDYVNLDLRRQSIGSEQTLDISHYAETYGWDLYEHFNFNEAGMRLNLTWASGLPHVLGMIEVYLPWEHVGELLTPVARRILLVPPSSTGTGN